MKLSSGLTAVALAVSVVACPAMATAIAQPSPGVYAFSGYCTDCSIPTAEALLIVPSTSFAGITFAFNSSNFPLGLQSDWVEVASLGPINASGYADSWILFGASGTTYDFTSSTTGQWMLSVQTLSLDEGRDGMWAARPVPEPATYAMWLLGAGLLAAAGTRRAKN